MNTCLIGRANKPPALAEHRCTSPDLFTVPARPRARSLTESDPLSTTSLIADPDNLPCHMPDFRPRPGTTTTTYTFRKPIANIAAFTTIIRTLVYDNPLGCTRYGHVRKGFPPVRKVREMYTAKFEYRNEKGKRIGTTIEMYDSVEGYETGIAAVISNMANIASHHGKPRHLPEKDLFSVMLQCHDPSGELYYLNIARNRFSLSSYRDPKIRERVENWTESVPELG